MMGWTAIWTVGTLLAWVVTCVLTMVPEFKREGWDGVGMLASLLIGSLGFAVTRSFWLVAAILFGLLLWWYVGQKVESWRSGDGNTDDGPSDDRNRDDGPPEDSGDDPAPRNRDDPPENGDRARLDAATLLGRETDRSFDDVAGMADLKRHLDERVVRPLRMPERYDEYGLGTVDGVLLHGPPGCGKTHTVGARAGEVGYNFMAVTPSDVTSKWVGEAADNVAELFAVARRNQPCIVFIDELDAVAGYRDGRMTNSEQQMVNQLLTELETVSDERVVVFGATNYVDDIDDAILRSGRFDERIEVPPPDADARRAILRQYLADPPTVPDLDLERAIEATVGYAASDVELVAEVAARRALAADERVAGRHVMAAVEETSTSIPGWLDAYDHLDGSVEEGDVTTDGREGVPDQRLADLAARSELRGHLRDRVLDPYRNSDRYAERGVEGVDGALLHGPPGCGKTFAARAMAGELDLPVVELTPEDIFDRSVPAAAIEEALDEAIDREPSCLLIDDVHAIAPADGTDWNVTDTRLAGGLASALGRAAAADVLVVGTTTSVAAVADDVLGAGSFDSRIHVPLPDADTRRGLLERFVGPDLLADGIDWDRALAATENFSVTDIHLVAQEAARAAIREDRNVTAADIVTAADHTGSSVGTRSTA